jgi:hypothetical protein
MNTGKPCARFATKRTQKEKDLRKDISIGWAVVLEGGSGCRDLMYGKAGKLKRGKEMA